MLAIREVLALIVTGIASQSAFAQQFLESAPCNVPVYMGQTGMGGMSTYNFNGTPAIILDPPVAMGDSRLKTFTVWHECGHLVHHDGLPNWQAQAQWVYKKQQELSADCYAAQNVSANISEATAVYFQQSQGNFSPAPGYPTGNQRAQNIRMCATGSQSPGTQQPQPTSSCPGLPPGMSLLCKYTAGPKAGMTQNFCGLPATPSPVGGPCTDGAASWGVAQ
jgi:hypothetical protein